MKVVAKKSSSQEAYIAKRFGNKNGVHSNARSAFGFPNHQPIIQRKSNCPCGGGCPRCREKELIQPKLNINQPGDRYEQEADRVADQVMRMPDSEVSGISKGAAKIQRKCTARESGDGLCPKCAEEEEIQRKPFTLGITLLQRQIEEPEEEEEEFLQAKETPGRAFQVSSETAANINTVRSGGQPLPEWARSFFEPRFGHDFSQVRVHTDARAAEIAQVVNARAFTVGKDVVFGAGQYVPGTSSGQRLLAHELTHTIQQKQAMTKNIQNKAPISIQRSNGQGNLPKLDEMLSRVINVPEEEVITLLGQLSLSEKQIVLSGTYYRSKMIAAFNNNEIARAVDALDAELAVKLDWMAAEGATYELVKPRIQAASSSEQIAVLNDHLLLESLRDVLTWDNFAKCVELLGRRVPTVDTLVVDTQVQDVIEAAWTRSNPGVRQIPAIPAPHHIHEEGGWIYLNIITNELDFRTKEGGPEATSLRLPPWVDDSIVIADFHTHPHLDWPPQPSPKDIATADGNGVPGIVRAEVNSQKEYFPYGPAVRKHLAGGKLRSWSYPWSSGGVAP